MHYRDLVQFDPIETIIQLRDADQEQAARDLIRTYVISDRMADQLVNVVIPQLQFLRPRDNKGVLIVGNYGTGKSHLMAVVSAIAEHDHLVEALDHPDVQEAAASIAGRFKVARTEIGGVTGSLRDILLRELEIALEAWGTPYTFPPADEITNNKNALIEAMGAFQERYPEQGLLLVVDELLDYLRTREERQLILDLGFLRELGEVAALTPFRFLAGLQETLFDSPRFAFVAQQLRRVRDRFEQVRIVREDIAYVVSHRLLQKNDEQLARITEHLRQFTHLYGHMAERLDEFAQLFPIHPAYLETFERVSVAEKREVLKTFSQAMRGLLDEEVPPDQPGLISYDHYWDILRGNPSMRGLPDVAEVIEKSDVLEGRIRNAYTRPGLKPVALRIIHALSVHRLTTHDIRAPLGVTPEELRDDLCLFRPLPEASADFLLSQVQVALREIQRTVTGQYISYNEANGQYYLDVDKDIDFEAKIQERGQFMEQGDLNRYFFNGLRRALNLSETTYSNGHRIWLYELPWVERADQRLPMVTRPGYLFFGAPDERSTAQPPRDFYVYIMPPFINRQWHDGQRADEVIFQLSGLDQTFEDRVRLYAGARAMAQEAASHRTTYAEKADEYLGKLLGWLRDYFPDHLQVTYQGVTNPVGTVLSGAQSSASETMEDLIRLIAAHLLAPEFEERYPDYPAFERLTRPVTESARPTAAMDAIRFLAGRGRTNLAIGVLDGLELLDDEENLRPYQSRYARRYLDLLQEKPEGQVVNRGELIEQVSGGIQPIEKDICFQLEPEWAVVVLLSLVYHGDVVLNLGGRETLDAGNIERAATRAMVDLVDFRFYKRPRTLPLNLWGMIFEGLGLAPGLVRDENTRRDAVQRLQSVVGGELERAATIEGQMQQGLRLWNEAIFTDRFDYEVESGAVVGASHPTVSLSRTELLPHLRGYKQFLEALSRFDTVGKLRNLRLTVTQVQEALDRQAVVERAGQLLDLVGRVQPLTAYLAEAQANLPSGPESPHPWSERAAAMRKSLVDDVRRFGGGDEDDEAIDPMHFNALSRQLETLKADYVAAYAEQHRRLTLGPQADDRRQRLYSDARLTALNALAAIDLLSGSELDGWKQRMTELPICREFHESAIDDTPTCPFCHLRPAQRRDVRANQTLDQLERQLDDILTRWRQALRDALTSETARRSLEAMTPDERAPIEQFLAQETDKGHPLDEAQIPEGFVESAVQALRGIEALALPVDGLLEALKEGGLPCTVEELKRRFDGFVGEQMRGHDPRNTRLTLETNGE
ncbi:MAG TPA: ATP-binding protein [Chloroflexi bacterium]|nr:ATP-binding protein [Chloroflexota bacterium]